MARTLIIGNEIAVPTTFGAATSLAQATVLRVVNVSGSTATIGVSTMVGAATTSFITIPTADGNVYINKEKVMLVTEVSASSCRIQYASDFGAYNDIISATESRTAVKAKL